MLNNQPIYILHGLSSYDVFMHWEQALQKAFSNLGVLSKIVRADMDFSTVKPPVITLGFDMVKKWSKENSEHLHIIWEIDHPAYMAEFYMPKFSKKVINHERVIVFCVDSYWCDFAKNYYKFDNIFFLPHASTCSLDKINEPVQKDRNFKIIMCGTFSEPSIFLDKLKVASGRLWDVLSKLAKNFTFAENLPLEVKMYNTFREIGLSEEQALIAINAFLPDLAHYHRTRTRLALLQAIKKHKVDIFGKFQIKSFKLPPNFTLKEPKNFTSIINDLSNYSILINNNPTLKGGGHERIFEALAHSCFVLTTKSDFLIKEFEANEMLYFYEPENPQIVDEIIEKIFDERQSKTAKVYRSRELVFQKHLFENRASSILNTFIKKFKPLLG